MNSDTAATGISKVLVANRGEIAIRIMAACRSLGISSVAVYSDADQHSKHVRVADESVHIGPTAARESYLNIDTLIAAAKSTGAGAIHPGYGFLAENAEFAERVAGAGLVFIGPPADAIEAMGEKVAARERARLAGVPQVPGTTEAVTDTDQVHAFGQEFGYPIAIKAAYGGGGRGMRLVNQESEVAEALDSARREALAAFGNADVYLEKYLSHARHVEVQVLADAHGSVVALGDRDCSIQRRHQKVVEECPAPGLSDDLRAAMGEASVRLAQAVGYQGAGTVEYLVQDGAFYFLEMNTRIQVEHPVTEEVWGVDLVAAQIRVAAGLPLDAGVVAARARGHAVEIRVNAEDCAEGKFLPAPGRLEAVNVTTGEGVRFDGGYDTGDEVLPHYDSLIGKLVVWAPTREKAIDRMLAVAGEAEFIGVPTTVPAALRILSHPEFRSAEISTRWLEERVAEGLLDDLDDPDDGIDPRRVVWVGDRQYEIPYFGELAPAVGQEPATPAPVEREGGARSAGRQGGSGRRRAGAASGTVVSPMQGTVVKVMAEPGETVEKGAVLFVIEAMKMENPVRAGIDGVVAKVNVALGDVVPAGAELATVTPV